MRSNDYIMIIWTHIPMSTNTKSCGNFFSTGSCVQPTHNSNSVYYNLSQIALETFNTQAGHHVSLLLDHLISKEGIW